ncbi:putative polypeptide N-acetylgalactosaminyltransferase 13 isoform X1 [Drosophila elegans]|uniref:putative polypeptide N-acetylgalactosaminyltransferase 13 isoform X1 n=1 Tax=Drosophila elegans TaxID=30023 RepID=UPI0007E75582|nr:putative polypeptide N-acetylgalactosaminyltransferase 13 isoform X1 [Drosophila elegans]XP_017131805.1 putative polypeptide N-acetylgalactosaminyltransferase 13 isoform X1 [Drosophila elegans]XP_017131807.1 putative polypeptide N-acetylgalactosaminyltransferase 13 isoform X1 [Drosophila elegans]
MFAGRNNGRPRRCIFYILAFLFSQFLFILIFLRSESFDNVPFRQQIKHDNDSWDHYLDWREFISYTSERSAKFYLYNLNLSNTLGVIRKLPSTRHYSCGYRPRKLPPPSKANVSVVISFHNEARSMLLRTIVSLLARTPEDHLHELILVDDGSQDVTLLNDLRRWMGGVFGARHRLGLQFLANRERMGLIWSRNRGASLASGHYVLFLDSHCEVNEGWLEPLLERLALNPQLAVSPVLDPIDPLTLAYRKGNELLKGGFDWSLHFHWLRRQLAEKELPEMPFKSPAFAGGILMMSREWFLKLGGFNSYLKIWGGESIELATKLWLCGGQIEIVPCSRIGHIFRRRHAFDFPPQSDAQETYLHNSKIIAESWLDKYKNMFYALRPAARRIPLDHTADEMQQLSRQLQCQPFEWYLRHVSPELRMQFEELAATGSLRNGDRCLHARQKDAQLILASCHLGDVTQWSMLRSSGQLSTQRELCLGVASTKRITLEPCGRNETTRTTQRWLRLSTHLLHAGTLLCLDNPLTDRLELSVCRPHAPSQSFQFALEMETHT